MNKKPYRRKNIVEKPFSEKVWLTPLYEAVLEVFLSNGKQEMVLKSLLKKYGKWTDDQKDAATEFFYYYIKNRNLLWYLIGKEPNKSISDMHRIYGVYCILERKKIPNDKIFKTLKDDSIFKRLKEDAIPPNIRYSWSNYAWNLLCEGMNESKAVEILKIQHVEPKVFIRCNTLLTDSIKLQKLLVSEGVKVAQMKENSLAFEATYANSLYETKAFKSGFFEIQDLHSQAIAPFTEAKPGQRIADICAGSGGKTLHLAALMHNQGVLKAYDTKHQKLILLKKRLAKAGVNNCEVNLLPKGKELKRHQNSFNAILIDAPCSGSGVYRRNPDSKWHIYPQKMTDLNAIQKDLLICYSSWVKTSGILVYAVCSVFNREGKQIIEWFLNQSQKFTLELEQLLLPKESGGDGFYVAVLRRKNE